MITKLNDISIKELKGEFNKITTALQVLTTSINNNAKVNELINLFQTVLIDTLKIRKAIFFFFNDGWEKYIDYELIYDENNETKKVIEFKFDKILTEDKNNFDETEINELMQIKNITTTNSINISNSLLNNIDIIIPIYHKDTQALSLLLISSIYQNIEGFYYEEFLKSISSIISVAIDNKRLANNLKVKISEENDLKNAAIIQNLLLPKKFHYNDFVEIDSLYKPKHIVGGDYFDFIEICYEEFVFCIADVSGKGFSSALVMSNFQANLRANIKYNSGNITLKQLVIELNNNMVESTNGEKFITFFIGYYNNRTKKLKYINAGHNYPIVIHGNNIRLLDKGCVGLGMVNILPFINEEELKMSADDIILCYTDGVTELENVNSEQFSSDRLGKILLKNRKKSPSEINDTIYNELNKFKESNSFEDDSAILCLKFKK